MDHKRNLIRLSIFAFCCFAFSLLVGCGAYIPPQDAQPNLKTSKRALTKKIGCVTPTSQTLYAGQHIDSGSVNVINDGTSLIVEFTSTGGWHLAETHLAVATSCGDIPQTRKGNPRPGKFAFKQTHDPAVTTYTYTLDLAKEGFKIGDTLCIAAHAVVKQFDGSGNTTASETGWADGNKFPGRSWATNFEYTLQAPCCVLDLPKYPDTTVTVQYKTPGLTSGGPSYFDTTVSNVASGLDVGNQVYDGWCVDSRVLTGLGPYQARLISTLDPDLATKCSTCADDEQWDKINYIINKDYSSIGATYMDLQNAIWYFADANPRFWFPTTSVYQTIVNDADTNGAGFVPKAGQKVAVITQVIGQQLTFIEVPVPSTCH